MNTTPTTPDIGAAEAGVILKVTGKTVREWMKTGRLKAVKVGGRFRTTREWIEETIQPVIVVANTGGREIEDSDQQRAKELVKAMFGIEVLGSKMHREV